MVGTQWKAQGGGGGFFTTWIRISPYGSSSDYLDRGSGFASLVILLLAYCYCPIHPHPQCLTLPPPPPWGIFISVIFLMSSCYSRVIILPSPSSSGVFIFVIVLPSPSSLGALTGG